MKKIKLTKSYIDSLQAPEDGKRLTVWDDELQGFCIRVSKKKKVYYAVKRIGGKLQWVNIGVHGPMNPTDARKEALKTLANLNKGIDVNKQKAQDRVKGITLKEALKDYFESKPKLREGTKKTYECLLNEWLSDWMEKPLKDIGKKDVSSRHLKIADGRSAVTANNVMRTFRAIYNHAQAVSDGALPESPTKILSRSKQWFHVGRRQTYIKEHELNKWSKAVISYSNPVAGDALLLLLLTGCREKEVLTLQWKDVDMKGKTFTIQATVAKNHREHTLPMSDAILDVFKRRDAARENDYVFPGQGGIGHIVELKRAVQAVTKKSKVKFCLHDLRRTFSGIAEQEVSYAMLKRLLNHYTGNDVTAGYLVIPTEQLRDPMQKITNRIMTAMLEPEEQEQQEKKPEPQKQHEEKGKVIPLRARR